jgi:hypothetical protein
LDSVYGFLQRRTDFYYEAEPGDKMGFPPGIAETMVSISALITKLLFRFTNISADIKRCIKKDSHQRKKLNCVGMLTRNNRKH